MINVYWGTEYIIDILDVLDSYNVKCTFFVGGQWVEQEPNLLKEIFNRGHEIGNHGFFHKDQEYLNYEQNYDEININHQLVKSILNIDMNLFAPPSGAYNQTTLEVAKELGYQTIMWTKDTIDWRDNNVELIIKRATNNLSAGDFILMHPKESTLNALDTILQYIEKANLKAITVSQNLL